MQICSNLATVQFLPLANIDNDSIEIVQQHFFAKWLSQHQQQQR